MLRALTREEKRNARRFVESRPAAPGLTHGHAQCLSRGARVGRDDRDPIFVVGTPGVEGAGDGGEFRSRMRLKPSGVPRGQLGGSRFRLGRNCNHPRGRRRGSNRRGLRGLEDDMRVRAHKAERAHAREARRAVSKPRHRAHRDRHGRAFKLDTRIERLEVQVRENLRTAHDEQCLQHSADARGSFEMPEIGLNRAQRQRPVCRPVAKHLAQSMNLDRIAERRGRAVTFHVTDVGGAHTRGVECSPQ